MICNIIIVILTYCIMSVMFLLESLVCLVSTPQHRRWTWGGGGGGGQVVIDHINTAYYSPDGYHMYVCMLLS